MSGGDFGAAAGLDLGYWPLACLCDQSIRHPICLIVYTVTLLAGPVAQSTEFQTCMQLVRGSNPRIGTGVRLCVGSGLPYGVEKNLVMKNLLTKSNFFNRHFTFNFASLRVASQAATINVVASANSDTSWMFIL